MNKHTFMNELKYYLKGLPDEEKTEIIQDFEEYFDIGKADGKNEEDIVQSLGSPQKLAKDLQATYLVEKAKIDRSAGSISRAVWAVIGLSFFNLLIVLGPFLFFATLILSLWVMTLSLILQVAMPLLTLVIRPDSFYMFELFFSITVSGIGVLLLLAVYPLTRVAGALFIKYLSFNIRLVKGGTAHE
ncbi:MULTISPECIES: HAAS signaling domain-containing protein [Gracilibacillus]|uniref:HAAS signaling domain-containing protein n=1 Tax=Gracilibacillus TaxID=74385 RepID=UPI00082436DA|nr:MULTISPECIES: DUF1700 domain-containing protein [Gracilibacillus]